MFTRREHLTPSSRLGRPSVHVLVGVALGLVLVVGAVVATTIARRVARAESETARPRSVRVAEVQRDDGVRVFRASGTTRAAKRAELSFTVAGRIEQRHVEIGAEVHAGDVLIELDSRPFLHGLRAAAAEARQARAHLRQAVRERRRARALSVANATSEAALDQVNSTVSALRGGTAAARTGKAEAERMLAETKLRAPFDGVIEHVLLEVGEFATPGRPAIVLSGSKGVEIEVDVPESHVHRIKTGDTVEVDLPIANRRGVAATVHRLGHSGGGIGRQFPVVVRLDADTNVVPGMAAEVVFRLPGDPGVAVPTPAIIQIDGERGAVFVVKDDRVHRVAVRAVELSGELMRVEGELEPGQRVVVGGQAALVDRAKVLVEREANVSSAAK